MNAQEPLSAVFARLIATFGPISVMQYMGEANARYYATRDPLGADVAEHHPVRHRGVGHLEGALQLHAVLQGVVAGAARLAHGGVRAEDRCLAAGEVHLHRFCVEARLLTAPGQQEYAERSPARPRQPAPGHDATAGCGSGAGVTPSPGGSLVGPGRPVFSGRNRNHAQKATESTPKAANSARVTVVEAAVDRPR